MKRETRDKMAAGTDQANLTSGTACMETPPAIYRKLSKDFGPFVLDLFADSHRRLHSSFFGPGSRLAEDALTADWSRCLRGDPAFGNPPYGRFVQSALEKAADESTTETSVLLLPMRATAAFHLHVLGRATDLLFCDRRITFYEYGYPRLTLNKRKQQMEPTAALFDSIIVVFAPKSIVDRFRTGPRVGTWNVPEHVSEHREWLDAHRSPEYHASWLSDRRLAYGEPELTSAGPVPVEYAGEFAITRGEEV